MLACVQWRSLHHTQPQPDCFDQSWFQDYPSKLFKGNNEDLTDWREARQTIDWTILTLWSLTSSIVQCFMFSVIFCHCWKGYWLLLMCIGNGFCFVFTASSCCSWLSGREEVSQRPLASFCLLAPHQDRLHLGFVNVLMGWDHANNKMSMKQNYICDVQ